MTAAFTGSIPELYDRYLGPVMFEPYAIDVAARLAKDVTKILEVAAGTGRVTRHLLERLPRDGALVATDFSSNMLDQARRKLPMDPRLHLQVADAQALPFADHRFDSVVCQFGLMFVPDKPLAMREMFRVLRPGGTLVLSTWNSLAANPANGLLDELVQTDLAPNAPPFTGVPFSMPDPAVLLALATDAGFTATVDTVDKSSEAKSAEWLANGFVRGNPLWNELVERGIDAAAFHAKVAGVLAERFGNEPCTVPISAHVLVATRP